MSSKNWVVFFFGLLIVACSGRDCGDNGSDESRATPSTEARTADASTKTIDSRREGDGGISGDAAPIKGDASGEAGPQGPRQEPMKIAQRFVVGWASGVLAPLEPLSDGEALALVQRGLNGESVDTPLGRLTPDRPRAKSFSFSRRRAARMGDGNEQILFDLSVNLGEGEPVKTSHVVTIRRSDGKVIEWIAPSPSGDGGV